MNEHTPWLERLIAINTKEMGFISMLLSDKKITDHPLASRIAMELINTKAEELNCLYNLITFHAKEKKCGNDTFARDTVEKKSQGDRVWDLFEQAAIKSYDCLLKLIVWIISGGAL